MTALVGGRTYTAQRSYLLEGKRRVRTVTFVAARNQEPEPFIRNRGWLSDMDRVFVKTSHGSAPDLFIAGSIVAVES